MKKSLLLLLCVVVLSCTAAPCVADTLQGVIAEERIINLPNDQAKWYVSVVGDERDARYQQILGWFNTNEKLVNLKNQVHFCQVTNDTAIYAERYSGNVRALPTIRVQQADGVVVYEAAGKNIPMSAEGLNGAIAESVRPVLPWRRNHVHPQPRPSPDPGPSPPLDPPPQPIDDGAAPILDESDGVGIPTALSVLAIVLSALAGAIAGVVVQWKRTYPE